MLITAIASHELGSHARLSDDNAYLFITEQIGGHESQTMDVMVRLTPALAKEIDFALSVYRQELEHG